MWCAVDLSPTTPSDILVLAATMRPDDAREAESSEGVHRWEALRRSVAISEAPTSVWLGGELACIYGIVPLSESVLGGRRGIIWMLTSGAVDRHAKGFLRGCKEKLPDLLAEWDVLGNHVDVRYEKAIRWGTRLGFKWEEARPFGAEQRMFRPFALTLSNLTLG